ncbi:MAG: ParA family protein, partial [Candidatus Kariarchaeaceae archaeon]
MATEVGKMRILMTHSFKGGSGKTIFSANIAKILARKGHKVLLIETDFDMPAFYSIFQDLNPDVYLNDFLSDR